MALEAGLYLIPTQLSDVPLERVLPAHNLGIVRQVRYFVVESLRSARRFLKKCDRSIDIDSLTFNELNEHSDLKDTAALEALLDPIARGEAVGIISDAGCPAVADPGADLVAIAQGLQGLSASGSLKYLVEPYGLGVQRPEFCLPWLPAR